MKKIKDSANSPKKVFRKGQIQISIFINTNKSGEKYVIYQIKKVRIFQGKFYSHHISLDIENCKDLYDCMNEMLKCKQPLPNKS